MNKENLKIYLIFFFSLILGILWDYLFYGKPIGVSFFVFVLTFLVFSLVIARNANKKISREQVAILIFIILLSFARFWRASSFLVFFNTIVSSYLIFLFLFLYVEKEFSNFNFLRYVFYPVLFIAKSFKLAAVNLEKLRQLHWPKKQFASPELKSAIKGALIAMPILAVFVWLFASADIVFEKYLNKLVNVSIDPEIIVRLLIIFVSSFLFCGFLSVILNGKKKDESGRNEPVKFLGSIENSVVLGSVCLLFFVFIAIQFFYLFGGKTYVWGIEEYITYADYARKGFGELIGVSAISFLLIYFTDKFGRRSNNFQKKVFKVLSSILVFELTIIMISASRRLLLYIDGYGFTFLRLFGFIFLLWLLIIFLLFLYKIFSGKSEASFLHQAFWTVVVFLLGMNVFNADNFIAKKNIERYLQGKQLDAWYFSQLSADAIPEIVKIFDTRGEEKIKIEIAMGLKWWKSMHQADHGGINQWQVFNEAESRAQAALKNHADEIKVYGEMYEKLMRETSD